MSNEQIKNKMPVPLDRVILSDLDGTLINSEYRFTDSGIVGVVNRVQSDGWKLGISSDTPYKALEVWRDRLAMNGPIIAEKGAVVEVESGLLFSPTEHDAFQETGEDIERNLRDKGFILWKGNPVEAIRDNIQVGNSGDQVVLINDLRLCSLGLFFRRVDRTGNLVIDSETTYQAMADIRQYYPPFAVDEDFNIGDGLVIVGPESANKRVGSKVYMMHEGLTEIGMIGDSRADFLGSDIALHYAVGNASSALKEIADYVSDQTYTKGVIEIYNNLQ